MIYEGIYTAGLSFLLNHIQYHVMVYRQGDNYRDIWQCCKCGHGKDQEPAISQHCKKAFDAARELAEQHHGQLHRRSAKAKATSRVAKSLAAR